MNKYVIQENEVDNKLDTSLATKSPGHLVVVPQDSQYNKGPSLSLLCPHTTWETLGKQYQEYKQSCPFMTAVQQKQGLYSLLPLFLQACEQTPVIVSIPDICVMASDFGTLLAMEMRKKISNKPADAARIALTSFLQRNEEEKSGYYLLKSVCLLSQKEQDILCCLIKTGLPDVFLQSLYLFLAFPAGHGVTKIQESENQVKEIFMQTMLKLCSHAQGVENLTRSSDFECLLKAAASGWDQCDTHWSEFVEKVLKCVSNALTPGMLHYLQSSHCIQSFLQTLSKQDFENTQGYPLLLKIILQCKGDSLIERGGEQQLNELLTLLTSLVICGKSEVKVSGQVSHPQLPGFSIGWTHGSGKTVKNLQAFQVLQGIFQSSMDINLCSKVLSQMQSLWALEHSNFFLLEWSLQPTSQFVEILPLKPPPVQHQFFQLIQFVVSKLSYIPHQILQKVQELIKQNQSPSCTLSALNMLQNIIVKDSVFCDLFRDSGLFGMLLTQLRNHAKVLRRAAASTGQTPEGECERELTIGRLQTVEVLLQTSVRNVVILKDYGMIPYIKIFLDDMGLRRGAICILEHISTIDPDEYMSTIMGALCSSTQAEFPLKLDLLQSLQKTLKSPKEQTSFRNAAGFDVLLSLISDMEGSLHDPPGKCWSEVQSANILGLIQATMTAMSAALFQNVPNQHFSQSQRIFEKMAEDLKQLGCFSSPLVYQTHIYHNQMKSRGRSLQELLAVIYGCQTSCSQSLRNCFIILSLLLGMAAGKLTCRWQEHAIKQITIELPIRDMLPAYEEKREMEEELTNFIQYAFSEVLDSSSTEDLVTVEPGALCVVISLIQQVYSEENQELSKEIQCAVLEHIHSLGRSERQRQFLCESQLLNCIVRFCRETLSNDGDPLRLTLIRLFEKLASQAVQPNVLRQFLCCGIAAEQCCEHETTTDMQANVYSHRLSSCWVLHTSMSLVSMTSPRRFQMHNSSMSPSFVEFDMSTHGSGCLFLPSVGSILGSNVEDILSGGVRTGGRNFPPPGGLNFSCWFLVSRFCLAPEPHPIRLLTIVRHMSRSQQHFVCLSIVLNAAERCLLVSTEEQEFQPLDMMEVEVSSCNSSRSPSQVQLNVSGLLVKDQWHHLFVALKDLKRSGVVTAWIDGQCLGSTEIHYVQRLPGGITNLDPSALVDIHAFIGTPQIWRQQSSLLWRLGQSYLFEEVLSEETMQLILKLGPSYCGNFKTGATTVVAEEKIVFGVNVLSSYFSTITKIRDMYNEVDGRHIAKEFVISSRDNSTPVFLSRNLASHLQGTTRTLGAVTVQTKGVRVFNSTPASESLNYIGGPAVMLSLIAMSTDDQALYAAIKALVSVLSSSLLADQLMQHIDGYRLLGYLLRRKSCILNPRIFQLILTITGTADVSVGPARPLNLSAVKHILCDFQIWLEVPGDLDVSLLTHLEEVLRYHGDAEIIQQLQLVPSLIFLLNDLRVTQTKATLICNLLNLCLNSCFNKNDISRLGLFLVSTLPGTSINEKQLYPQDPPTEDTSADSGRLIWLRNQLLHMLIRIMCPPSSSLSEQQQDEVVAALGPDWFLLFIQPSVHPSSVDLGMKLLGQILQSRTLLARFSNVTRAGACVENNTYELHLLMDNLRGQDTVTTYNFPLVFGFRTLICIICHHWDRTELYLLLSSVLLRTPLVEVSTEGDVESKLQDIFHNHSPDKISQHGLCLEGALLLMAMVKSILYQKTATEDKPRLLAHSKTVMQFLCLVYDTYPQDPLWIASGLINALASLLFLPIDLESCDAEEEGIIPGTQDLPVKTHEQYLDAAKKPIQKLMHLILKQNLTQLPTFKHEPPLEYLLEVFQADVSIEKKSQFQTEILLFMMDIFHAVSHRGESENPELHAGNEISEAVAIANQSYFSQKLLEKMLSGIYIDDPCKIPLFFIKQITAVTHTTAPCNRDSLFTILYDHLNRSILHCLSRSRTTLSGMKNLQKVLELLLSHWDVIFATYNASTSFLACFLHCLFQIFSGSYPEGFGIKSKVQRKSWQLIFLSEEEEGEEQKDSPDMQDAHVHVLQAVHKVWEQLMVYRGQLLEEYYKIDLYFKQGECQISQVTPLWEEIALKAWQQYLVSEKKTLKSKNRTSAGPGQRITAAVRGLYEGNGQDAKFKPQEAASSLNECRRIAQDLFECLYRDNQEIQQCQYMAACRDWSEQEQELLSEVGVWGLLQNHTEHKWELSPSEGPWHIRKRMQPFQRKLEILSATETGVTSLLGEIHKGTQMRLNEQMSDGTSITFFPTLPDNPKCSHTCTICPERLNVLREFPEKEKIFLKMAMVLVEAHVIMEGVLMFGKNHFYLCPQFTLSASGDVTCIAHGKSSIEDPFIHDLCYKDTLIMSPKDTEHNLESSKRKAISGNPKIECFPFQDLLDVQPMRFLMQEIALEIYLRNRTSKFLVFPNKDMSTAMKWFQSSMSNAKGKVADEDSQHVRSSAGEKVMLQKWQRREIGNFEYLMFLNSLSGRTIRDLMQYPVIPWVLRDYKSENLYLSDPKVFRDLSRPMGAQTRERSQKFIQRYKDVENNDGDLSVQCHYCTHYSSASIVSSYLVRVEPFTQAMRWVQGGPLDLADRLFHNVAGVWESASSENMSDVRELIPEFYYLPEMFINSNHCQLGCMQDGTVVGDVLLPPWAHGDPQSFVRLHSEALESEYVSSQIHHWIDLVFGYKQRGPAAVHALNVFHPYFYGSPDYLNSTDPLVRTTLIGFISNFGQVPKQLFTKPHPLRHGKELSSGHTVSPFYSAPCSLKQVTVTPRGNLRGAVGHMLVTEKAVFAAEKNHVLLSPSYAMSLSWGYSDGSLKLQNRNTRKVVDVWELMSHWGWCHSVICPSPAIVITAMSSSVLCVWIFSPPGQKERESELQLKKVLTGHGSAVLCVCASVKYGVLISGSADGSCILWDLDNLKCVRKLPIHPREVTLVAVNDRTGAFVSCCHSDLYMWSVNGKPLTYIRVGSNILSCCFGGLSVIVTGSQDGIVRFWKMESAEDKKIIGLGGDRLGTSLRMFHQLAPRITATRKQQHTFGITALAVSRNNTKLFVGDERGIITSWYLD
ncbi:WD repeat- and FYVE domain-containing protein 4 isoform X3 [Xenopus tropicalis]|uniref:WD repeat- and FYVE domain-containing protein 4 isoform X3 n=1 Tax=Xenopus tropicalis TaxID=8364 RepID=A0A6I8Q0H1_XENTR|nr:WD repeat- and FYVE domain-containing protein 4 isoform X3 [Xenopus tropicalis]